MTFIVARSTNVTPSSVAAAMRATSVDLDAGQAAVGDGLLDLLAGLARAGIAEDDRRSLAPRLASKSAASPPRARRARTRRRVCRRGGRGSRPGSPRCRRRRCPRGRAGRRRRSPSPVARSTTSRWSPEPTMTVVPSFVTKRRSTASATWVIATGVTPAAAALGSIAPRSIVATRPSSKPTMSSVAGRVDGQGAHAGRRHRGDQLAAAQVVGADLGPGRHVDPLPARPPGAVVVLGRGSTTAATTGTPRSLVALTWSSPQAMIPSAIAYLARWGWVHS